MTDRTSEPLPRGDHDEKHSTGLARRHIIQGAAWSVPVIMVATTAPAYAAASTKPVTLAFNQPTYTARGCQTITGATVKATVDNGVPQAGISVSILLPNGYTFSGGSTTYTGVTNGSGLMSVPAITTPATGGTQSLTATAAASSSTASASATSQTNVSPGISGYAATNATQGSQFSSIPVGAVPLGSSYFLSGQDLYYENTKMASGVISAYVYANLTSALVSYNTSSGGNRAAGATVAETYSGVPTSARSVGADYYLTNGGALYYKGSQVATGVQSAVGGYRDSHYAVDYIDASDAKRLMYEGVQQGSAVTYPTAPGAPITPLGGEYFLTGMGDLYYQNTKVSPGVLSVSSAYPTWYEHNAISFSTAAGTYRANYGAITDSSPAVPPGSASVGADFFLSPSGDIYLRGVKVASGAVSASGWNASQYWMVSWVDSSGAWRLGRTDLSGAFMRDGSTIQLGIDYATPLGGDYFLAGMGDLYYQNTKVSSGVLSVSSAYPTWYEHNAISFSTAAGTYRANYGAITDSSPAVPAGSTAVGADFFLSPSGDIYLRGVKVASGAVSASGWNASQYWMVSWVDSSGAWRLGRTDSSGAFIRDGSTIQLPVGSVPYGSDYALSPSGNLYCNWGSTPGTPILTNVTSVAAWIENQYLSRVAALTADGKVRQFSGKTLETTLTTSFPGGRVLNNYYVLSASGDLYQNDTLVTSNVFSAQAVGNFNIASIVMKDGTAKDANGTTVASTFTAIPFLPVPYGSDYALSPSGKLYCNWGSTPGTPILTNVTSVAAWIENQYLSRVAALTADGKVRQFSGKTLETTLTTSFPGGRVLNSYYVLSASGDLYQNDTLVTSNVSSAQALGNFNVVSIVMKDGTTKGANGTTVGASFAIANHPLSIGGGFARTPNGDLYLDTTKVASNITQASAWIASGTTPSASALGTDGKVRRIAWSGSATTTTLSTDFSGAIVLRGGYMLTTSEILYYNDSQVSTGVFAAAGYQRSDSTASFTKYDC